MNGFLIRLRRQELSLSGPMSARDREERKGESIFVTDSSACGPRPELNQCRVPREAFGFQPELELLAASWRDGDRRETANEGFM